MGDPLYLAAYDVTEPKRLQQALDVLKGYSTGGQKSAFECFLSGPARSQLLQEVRQVLDLDEDRFLLAPISPGPIHCLGIAIPPENPDFFYIG